MARRLVRISPTAQKIAGDLVSVPQAIVYQFEGLIADCSPVKYNRYSNGNIVPLGQFGAISSTAARSDASRARNSN